MNELEKALFQLERNPSNQIIWKQGQKEKIVELYQQGNSMAEIIRKFNGLHYNTIKKILVANNIPLRTRAQSHYKDNRLEDIFEKIDTEEKAYWLGFLAADGCVYGNYIRITLQEGDIAHLQKFQNFTQVTSVKILSHQEEGRSYVTFSFGCKKMAEDLKKHGIVENKTLILQPSNIPSEFEFDWIRGYFDGDGGLSYSKQNNRWQSYANSTKEVLEWICAKLQLNTKPFQQKHYGKVDNVYRIHFSGRVNVYKVWNKLMKDNTVHTFLNRKYNLYLKLRDTFNQ